MLSKYKSTQETTNTARLARLILGPCTDALRDLLKRKIPPSDLSKEMKKWIDDLKKNKKRNPLNPSQNDIIFPSPTNQYGGDYSDLDISILYIILRNICKIPPHLKGWGENPDPGDRSVAANIERIRLLRNKYGHPNDISLSDSQFRPEWRNIHDIIVELEGDLGTSTVYQESVIDIKTCSMDPELERTYIEKLGAVSEALSCMKKKLINMRTDPKLEKKIETSTEMIRCHHEEMADVFVKTRACDNAKELLERNGHVIIKGIPGAGKTTIAKWLLKAFIDRGKRPLQLFKISKLYGQISPFDNLAIFIDNAFGEFSVSLTDFNEFVNKKELIESLVKHTSSETGNVLILTIRSDIYMEIAAKQNRDSLLHSSLTDLSLGEYALEDKEIVMFFNNYQLPDIIKEDLQLRQAELYRTLGFPQCCRLAKENPDIGSDPSSFISSPSFFLKVYMETLIENNAVKMAGPIYMLLKGGRVESSLFSDEKDQNMKFVALKMLQLNPFSVKKIHESVQISEEFLTSYDKINEEYTFSHSSVQEILFDVLIVAFPDEIIKNCHHVLLQRLTTSKKIDGNQTVVDFEMFKTIASRIIIILTKKKPRRIRINFGVKTVERQRIL